MPSQTTLPRWRGFNLLGLFSRGGSGEWEEDDFRWIAELGFDFVRLPMSYRWWVLDDDPDVWQPAMDALSRIPGDDISGLPRELAAKSVYKKGVEGCRGVSKEEAGKVRRSRTALGIQWR